jgi:hypothetical protein
MIEQLPDVTSLPVICTERRETFMDNILAQVIVVDASALIRHIFSVRTWDTACGIFQHWCEVNRVEYYARPRDKFDMDEAVAQAINNRRPYLIVEDLS